MSANEVKLYGKWSFEDIEVSDISLQDYIAVKPKFATFTSHTGGRYQTKRFRKAQCPIVERLTNSMMMHGRNNGKKIMAVRGAAAPAGVPPGHRHRRGRRGRGREC